MPAPQRFEDQSYDLGVGQRIDPDFAYRDAPPPSIPIIPASQISPGPTGATVASSTTSRVIQRVIRHLRGANHGSGLAAHPIAQAHWTDQAAC
jgi:hypothetical protein